MPMHISRMSKKGNMLWVFKASPWKQRTASMLLPTRGWKNIRQVIWSFHKLLEQELTTPDFNESNPEQGTNCLRVKVSNQSAQWIITPKNVEKLFCEKENGTSGKYGGKFREKIAKLCWQYPQGIRKNSDLVNWMDFDNYSKGHSKEYVKRNRSNC